MSGGAFDASTGNAHGQSVGELCGHLKLRIDVVRVLKQAHEIAGAKISGQVMKLDVRNDPHIRRIHAPQEISESHRRVGFPQSSACSSGASTCFTASTIRRHSLVHAQGACKQDNLVLGCRSRVPLRISSLGQAPGLEIVLAADVRQNHSTELLPKLFVGHRDLVEQRNERLAVPCPRFCLGACDSPDSVRCASTSSSVKRTLIAETIRARSRPHPE